MERQTDLSRMRASGEIGAGFGGSFSPRAVPVKHFPPVSDAIWLRSAKAARQTFGVSQPVFELILAASVQAVLVWEQRRKVHWRRRFGLGEPENT
jgi:hypothetical protein